MTQHHQKKETVRLTIDFPTDLHTCIKMLAAKEGVSMRQYVIESLTENLENQEAKPNKTNVNKFKKALDKIIAENDDILKRLAGK